MHRGPWHSLLALLSGTAFAVAVAGPPQWCACPMHGADPHADALAMQMAAAGHDMPASGSHAGGTNDSHHAGHQCTCPGGCCASGPVALRTGALLAAPAMHVEAASRIDSPRDAIALAPSVQVALPYPNAPPSLRVPLQHAASVTT